MSRSRIGITLVIALGLTACQEQVTEPTPLSSGQPELALQASTVDGTARTRGDLLLPEGARITDQYLPELASRAINPDDYVCPPSTPVIDWYIDGLYDIINNEPAIFNLLYNVFWADLMPTYYALYFDTDENPQYFGYNGEYTHVMQKTHRDTKRFWDIESSDIQLIGMHGAMLNDHDATSMMYQWFWGLDAATADLWATLTADALAQSTTLNGGDHPLFSFNAFAISASSIGDKIVMGDGMLAGYEALGYGDVAPQAIYAHEFAHHIQFENGYFNNRPGDTAAERTRYTELMADAMSAYYLTHARGLAMNKHRVAEFLGAFYEIGDCAFSNPGHHGTPAQRMRAAQFGFAVADQAHKQGHILSSHAFYELFVAAYPDLIAPDAV